MNVNMANIIGNFKRGVSANKPKLLLGGGILSTIGAIAWMWVNTEKAATLKQAKREELADSDADIHPVVERLKIEAAALPAYGPALGLEAVGVASVIAGGKVFNDKNVALASFALAKSDALAKYKDKVVEKLGENKATAVEEEVIVDEMKRRIPQRYEDIMVVGEGEQLYYDTFSGRWFFSSDYIIHKNENLVNQRVNTDGSATVNDWFDLNGLDEIPIGDQFGWDANADVCRLMEISLVPTSLCIGDNPEISAFAIKYNLIPLGYDWMRIAL